MVERIMGQLERLAKKRCYYAGRAINPECFSCEGKNKECSGFISYEDFTKGDEPKDV